VRRPATTGPPVAPQNLPDPEFFPQRSSHVDAPERAGPLQLDRFTRCRDLRGNVPPAVGHPADAAGQAAQGFRVELIGLPMIGLAALALALLFVTVARWFTPGTAVLSLALLATDPTFLVETRLDFGPVVLALFCRVAALFWLQAFLDSLKRRYLVMVYLTLAAGLFNKLDFVWFINSLVLGVPAGYWRGLRDRVRLRPAAGPTIALCSAVVAGFIVLWGYFFVLTSRFHLWVPPPLTTGAGTGLPFTSLGFSWVVAEFLSGRFPTRWLDVRAPGPDWLGYTVLLGMSVVLAMGLIASIFDPRHRHCRRAYWLFLVLIGATLGQIGEGVARGLPLFHPWHLFAIYPFLTVSVVTSIWLLQRSLTRWIPADACLGAVALLVAAMLTYNVTTYARYVEAFDKPPLAIAWSAKIYELIAYTQAEPARFASLDWGIHNQLIVFTAQRGKYVDLTSRLNRAALGDSEEGEVAERYLDPVRHYEFIAHPVGRTVFPTARTQLFAIAERRGYHLSLHRVIADGGQPVFEIYRPQAAPGSRVARVLGVVALFLVGGG
jgi:hypothetical protein